jgi:hypothetical protein
LERRASRCYAADCYQLLQNLAQSVEGEAPLEVAVMVGVLEVLMMLGEIPPVVEAAGVV